MKEFQEQSVSQHLKLFQGRTRNFRSTYTTWRLVLKELQSSTQLSHFVLSNYII